VSDVQESLRAAEDCPLQRVIAEPITDPAEQAALDKIRKREKRKQRGPKAKMNRNDARAASNSAARKTG
jgi:hypothetical protein